METERFIKLTSRNNCNIDTAVWVKASLIQVIQEHEDYGSRLFISGSYCNIIEGLLFNESPEQIIQALQGLSQ